MKFAVIVFPGSNCDHDAYYVLKNIGFDVRFVWHKENDLSTFDAIYAQSPLDKKRIEFLTNREVNYIGNLKLSSVGKNTNISSNKGIFSSINIISL